MLFCERMDPHEALLIVGMKKYANYTGYGDTLEFVPLTKEEQLQKQELD